MLNHATGRVNLGLYNRYLTPAIVKKSLGNSIFELLSRPRVYGHAAMIVFPLKFG